MRINELLDTLDTVSKTQLKKLLPKGLKMPEAETQRLPSALLGAFPKEYASMYLGIVTKELLRLPAEQIKLETLLETVSAQDAVEESGLTSISKSKTTQPFLDLLKETRQKIESAVKGQLEYRRNLKSESVEGHPDAMTPTQIFEIDLAVILKQQWTYSLLKLFAYAALEPSIQELYLVLPLQRTVWHYSIYTSGWKDRKAYRDFLNQASKKFQANREQDYAVGTLLRERFFIGFHASKQKTLMDTVQSLPDYKKPYQIFLGGPQNTRLQIEDGELAATANLVKENRVKLFIHSQYIINLCTKNQETDWNTKLLIKNLQYGSTIGSKGVVVHVGKSTTQDLSVALNTMKQNILSALEYATEECPLLLETPAGQGSETLKAQQEFINFVLEIGSPRLRVCLDTCHVFACGHKPLDYIESLLKTPGLVKLIHYNDSAAPCGSCVDRHAYMGTGHIGMDGMKAIAELCGKHDLPMVIE